MQLVDVLTQLSKRLKVSFTFKGKPLSYAEVFASDGIMPGLAKRADNLAQLAIGYGLGAQIDSDEKTLLGTKVSFDEYTPQSLRVLCFLDIICELKKNSPSQNVISLDELMYD